MNLDATILYEGIALHSENELRIIWCSFKKKYQIAAYIDADIKEDIFGDMPLRKALPGLSDEDYQFIETGSPGNKNPNMNMALVGGIRATQLITQIKLFNSGEQS